MIDTANCGIVKMVGAVEVQGFFLRFSFVLHNSVSQ